eukprot:COSAG01_NODE_2023_length_8616_cov_89.751673_10_plen_200_part_00
MTPETEQRRRRQQLLLRFSGAPVYDFEKFGARALTWSVTIAAGAGARAGARAGEKVVALADGFSASKMPQEEECPLCYEKPSAIGSVMVAMPGCGHQFCAACLRKLALNQRKTSPRVPCPFCRGEIQPLLATYFPLEVCRPPRPTSAPRTLPALALQAATGYPARRLCGSVSHDIYRRITEPAHRYAAFAHTTRSELRR